MTVSATVIASRTLKSSTATLPVTRPRLRVAIDVRQEQQDQHGARRYEDSRDQGVEAREQLLEPGEVPGRLRRLGGDVRIREPAAAAC